MAEEKTLTEREAVLRERKAFCAGSEAWPYSKGAILAMSLSRYPLPVKKRYVHLKFSDGSVWSRMDERSCACWSGPRRYATLDLVDIGKMLGDTAEDYEMIARIIRGELEDVPEGEE